MIMYSIKIDNEIVAVSNNILTAMRSLKKLVADCIEVNEDAVEFKTEGIRYSPQYDRASAILSHGDELFVVIIAPVKLI